MLGDISKVENIYIACGYTDLRLGIDGLAQLVQRQFRLDPFFLTNFHFTKVDNSCFKNKVFIENNRLSILADFKNRFGKSKKKQ